MWRANVCTGRLLFGVFFRHRVLQVLRLGQKSATPETLLPLFALTLQTGLRGRARIKQLHVSLWAVKVCKPDLVATKTAKGSDPICQGAGAVVGAGIPALDCVVEAGAAQEIHAKSANGCDGTGVSGKV